MSVSIHSIHCYKRQAANLLSIAEHVYEAQSLKLFMLFLQGSRAPLPAGYKAASNTWVSEVLLGLGGGSRKHSASSWNGRTLWEQMSLSIGSTKKLGGLVIADRGMNGKKQKFFEGVTPTSASDNIMKDTMLVHRSTVGVFWYMKLDDIWQIFKETSQEIEEALHEFDQSYSWGSANDGPTRPNRGNGQPTAGLRDLYCYWIEMELGSIETKAAIWHTEARSNFEAAYKSTGGNEATSWLKMFSSGRPLGADQLKFKQATVGHSKPDPSKPDIWTESNYSGLWKTGSGYGAAGPF
jgi:chitinase